MKSIHEVASRSLLWKVVNDTYELRAGADLLAIMKWQKGVSLYMGEAAEGRWSFKRTGIFRTKLTVRPENSSKDLATLGVSGAGGSLDLPDGRKYVCTGGRGEWSFKDSGGELLIQIKSMVTIENLGGEVVLSRTVLSLPEASLLVLFGWYVLVLQAKDRAEDEAAAVAALGLASM
jgi:hypothetical protein